MSAGYNLDSPLASQHAGALLLCALREVIEQLTSACICTCSCKRWQQLL
jgi:hypothetical protein